MKTYTLLIVLQVFTFGLFAQSADFVRNSTYETEYKSYVFSLDDQQFSTAIEKASVAMNKSQSSIRIPSPDGDLLEIQVIESPIIHADLAAKYPSIKTYKVKGDHITGRVGYTYKGFHGILFTEKGTIYIDPIENNSNDQVYKSYYKSDYQSKVQAEPINCLTDEEEHGEEFTPQKSKRSNGAKATGDEFRKYRIAISCTGEYSQFHGGTTPGVLSAMVVTMNRVNGVYERDFAIQMEIIANNDLLIFHSASTDPFTNNSSGDLIDENQDVIDSIIGTPNYDIGHIFSTGGGGLASLRSVCNSNRKASGVTGRSAPVGDPFDIDYVAHEIGHQFGGNHTQNNSCNRRSTAAYEPGSASTIMGYAGICAPNLQNNSDDYFHSHSYDEIIDYAYFGNGNGCAVITNTGNTPPQVTVPSGGFYIPKETPFELTGSATDLEGDNLTYCWEQMDLGPSGDPDSPVGNAPIFRSWSPMNTGTRIFPRMSSIMSGNNVVGETYATYERDMTFRLTVRDNNIDGGGVDYEEVDFKVDDDGPFEVLTPLAGQQVEGGNAFLVEWDVANTDQAPVNCNAVNIYLSYDLGINYPDTLAMNVPNTGSASVIMPQLTGPTYRVRVQAADNIFFNINAGVFTLTAPTGLDTSSINLGATLDWPNKMVELNWNDPFTNENYFVIERSLNGNSNFVVFDTVPANTTTYIDSTAQVNTSSNHYYKVYAINSVNNSNLSNEATYLPSGKEDILGSGSISFYPNPTSDVLNISFEQPTQQESTLQVVDGLNRVLKSSVIAISSTNHQIDVAELAAGTYWVVISNKEKQQEALPFQVVK